MKENLPESLKKLIGVVEEKFADDPEMVQLFITCFTNTLDTTVKKMPDGTTHVITGDIPAMWLRDSVAQLRPYLIAAAQDSEIADLLVGLSKRQFFFINHDPYANAFNQEANGNHWAPEDIGMSDWIWERKYEIDSLCYPVQFAYLIWKNTGRTDHFDENFVNGIRTILNVWKTEQYHEEKSEYRFERKGGYFLDTLSREGKGALVKSGVGLIWSAFRPSDDACVYGYLIPSNMFATVVLGYVETIAKEILKDEELAKEAAQMKKEIHDAIETIGIVSSWYYGKIYAYETDGYGQYLLMDDANVPSLLAMDYLGYEATDREVVESTRKFILSNGNPYYFEGEKAKGIGSPHTYVNYIWHIALAIQGLTSKTREEKLEILKTMKATDGGKGMMHEGFDVNDPTKYTREWFSWPNALFCELMLDYCGIRVKK
ncbi:MAG: glycoside hydrolase family 125 protein [Lachnospiraceae bacterium]|nr:glycoside hydrolase family 125 protein [Lachnospiraceae bacterium]